MILRVMFLVTLVMVTTMVLTAMLQRSMGMLPQ